MEGTTPDHAHQPPQSRPVLFISHLTEDRQVADVLTHFVRAHSGGLVQVFQTSTDIAQSGRHQRQHLMQALWDAIVIILVYTDSTKDWSYCIWECGVAAQPPKSGEARDTDGQQQSPNCVRKRNTFPGARALRRPTLRQRAPHQR
jgi:hypothetical protein